MSYLKKIVGSILLFLCAAVIVGNLVLYFFEPIFIFKPQKYPLGNWQPSGPHPVDVWITSGNIKLHGWYLPHAHPKAIILYLHGNTGNVTNTYQDLLKLHDRLSASVMTFDYEGFGKSTGAPEENNMINDAKAVRDWLAQKEQVQPYDILLFGRSLGGGVAIALASKFGAKGLIIVSSFLSLPDTIKYHYPILFPRLLMHNEFDSIHNIASYHGQLLMIHGKKDELIPLQHAKKLFDVANSAKRFMQVDEGQHFSPISNEVYSTMLNFIEHINK